MRHTLSSGSYIIVEESEALQLKKLKREQRRQNKEKGTIGGARNPKADKISHKGGCDYDG